MHMRRDGRAEIRETVSTERGPRSRTLAIFRDVLRPEVLEQAQARASRPLDVGQLIQRAEALGIRTTTRREDRQIRDLLVSLRRGAQLDPILVKVLRDALGRIDTPPVPEALAEVAEWVGASEAERGEALRGLLRVYGRIAESRPRRRRRRERRFPRFRSRAA